MEQKNNIASDILGLLLAVLVILALGIVLSSPIGLGIWIIANMAGYELSFGKAIAVAWGLFIIVKTVKFWWKEDAK